MDRLRPHQQGRGRTIGFAYQNEGGLARIDKVISTSQGKRNVWSFELTIEEDQRGFTWNESSYNFNNQHYSSDDIAELRAGRLLRQYSSHLPVVGHVATMTTIWNPSLPDRAIPQ